MWNGGREGEGKRTHLPAHFTRLRVGYGMSRLLCGSVCVFAFGKPALGVAKASCGREDGEGSREEKED